MCSNWQFKNSPACSTGTSAWIFITFDCMKHLTIKDYEDPYRSSSATGSWIFKLLITENFLKEQTYQSTVIWLRIMNWQVAHRQTIAVTKAGMVYKPGRSPEQIADKLLTKCGQSQIQPPFQDLAPGWKQTSPDNNERHLVQTWQSCRRNMQYSMKHEDSSTGMAGLYKQY